MANLLSTPTLVESPFIILKIGNYTFGTYTSNSKSSSLVLVNYPNFVKSVEVTKVNGAVNTYSITMQYLVTAGSDPNLLDKVFSSVGYSNIKISYGDWNSPSFTYREEEALITNVTSQLDFSSSSITYVISCTSTAMAVVGGTHNFPARKEKPSNIIINMLKKDEYGLKTIFTGMQSIEKVLQKGLIATNDKAVEIPPKNQMDSLTYLNYLVSCMSSNTNTSENTIKNSIYTLTIYDDIDNDLGGSYFKIKEVSNLNASLDSIDTYEVDIGYPSDNLVTNFTIRDNNSWALLYNYSELIKSLDYVYHINDEGKMTTKYSPNISTSNILFKTTEALKTWWTKMTSFPISAELTIKGLVRPVTLMTYVRIHSYFYGLKHVSSGLYIVTKQLDRVDSSGYRTILSLTRLSGDS